MTSRTRGSRAAVMATIALLIVAAAAIALVPRHSGKGLPPRSEAEKPVLMLLTSLPLVFPERFGLEGGGSPALTALEKRYQVVPIPVADRASLRGGKMLLMAHASAQPAEALVDLDRWVRDGGRLLLLADPMLEWESERPLGDPLRPSPMFADTGLLKHWGLRLEAPEKRGPAEREIGGWQVLTLSPGTLSGCAIAGDGLVARCRIGKGVVTAVADADFLDVDRLDGRASRNLDLLIQELAGIEPK